MYAMPLAEINDPVEVPPLLEAPDYEHIPACMWPPGGCLAELPDLWWLTGRRIELPGGCRLTIPPADRKGMWWIYRFTVDSGELPDIRIIVNYVHQRVTIWDDADFAPTLALGEKPNEFILCVW